jgi:hypothetical protein
MGIMQPIFILISDYFGWDTFGGTLLMLREIVDVESLGPVLLANLKGI